MALMNAAGEELVKLYDWVWLTRTATITSVASQATYDRPAGWQREISDTAFNRTQKWPVREPVSPQEWEWLQAGYGLSPPYYRARPVPGQIEIFPVPLDALTTIAYEYVSSYWVLGLSGSTNTVDKLAITLDNDYCIFDNRLIISFTKLKFFEVKGFETTKLEKNFENALEYAKGQDRGARSYDLLNPLPNQVLLSERNFPDSITT